MPRIELLDEQTIDKIAAGEVVERPSSVVKELVENAIDARATAVTVEIRDGGTTLIRITDNGCGIEKEQIPIAFFRHSTSKIRSVEDLVTISSLGFRGEALSSIASVSQVELITKTMESLTGCRYLIEGGKEILLEETGAPDGTTFLVKNLFYNTPARRKFLKSPQTEAGYISDMMERIALSHPDISFKFINNGQIRLHTSGNSRLKDIIYHIYGRDIAANLLEVNGEFEGFSVSGFIGKPVVSRGNRNFESYFINGRYIKSKLIAKAIEDGYHGFMMQHKYPFTVLLISVDGKLVDVNVHPNKMELRFSDGEQLYRSLFHLIQSTLKNRELIADVSLESGKKANAKPMYDKDQIPEPFEKNRLRQVRKEREKEDTGRSTSDSFLHTAEPQPPEASIDLEIPVSQSVREPLRYGYSSAPNQNKDSADTASHRQVANGEDLLQNTQLFPDTDSAHRNHPLTRESDTLQQNQGYRQDQAVPDHEAEQQHQSAQHHDESAQPIQQIQQHMSDQQPQPVQHHESVQPIQPIQQTLADYNLPETRLLSDEAKPKHRLIGQLFDTYWLVEFQDRFYMIDQHAAHEKILFEQMMRRYREKEFTSQMISPPILLSLSMQEEMLLNKYKSEFEKLGFIIEPFGGKEYTVSAVPADLYGLNARNLLLELIDDLSSVSEKDTPEMVLEKIAGMSCKAAVKGNNRLSRAEAEQLINDLLKLENPYFCPHGRPVIVSMTKYEIEKKFKRIV